MRRKVIEISKRVSVRTVREVDDELAMSKVGIDTFLECVRKQICDYILESLVKDECLPRELHLEGALKVSGCHYPNPKLDLKTESGKTK